MAPSDMLMYLLRPVSSDNVILMYGSSVSPGYHHMQS
jgi:hypothetical protein